MSEWQPIETALKDGSAIHAKRVYEGRVVYEGPAAWRTVHFPALPPHPLTGEIYGTAHDATGWMYPDIEKRVPEPTHWRPS